MPFRCRKCHEYGQLFKEYPLNVEEEERKNKQQRKTTEDDEGFQEVKLKKRPTKVFQQNGRKEQQTKSQETNRYEILQIEEGEGETRNMDYQEETNQEGGGKKQNDNNNKQKAQEEPEVKRNQENEVYQEYEVMEVDINKGDDPTIEEEILKNLLDKWKNLDEQFILEEDKKLYKDIFQKYKEKQESGKTGMNEQLGTQQDNSQEHQNKGKGGKMRTKEPTRIHSNDGRNVSQHRKSSAAFNGLPPNNTTILMIIISWNIRGLNSKGKKR